MVKTKEPVQKQKPLKWAWFLLPAIGVGFIIQQNIPQILSYTEVAEEHTSQPALTKKTSPISAPADTAAKATPPVKITSQNVKPQAQEVDKNLLKESFDRVRTAYDLRLAFRTALSLFDQLLKTQPVNEELKALIRQLKHQSQQRQWPLLQQQLFEYINQQQQSKKRSKEVVIFGPQENQSWWRSYLSQLVTITYQPPLQYDLSLYQKLQQAILDGNIKMVESLYYLHQDQLDQDFKNWFIKLREYQNLDLLFDQIAQKLQERHHDHVN